MLFNDPGQKDSLKVVSWNVARRASKAALQVEAVMRLEADIVAFQEVTVGSVGMIENALQQSGLKYVAHTAYLAENSQKRFCVLVASRWSFTLLPYAAFALSCPERLLPLLIESNFGELEFYTVHIPPGSSNGWLKIATLQGIYQQLACSSPKLRLLCGDFNTPQAETRHGQIITWGERILKSGKLAGTGSPWDQGERNVLAGLADYDLRDVYRLVNGYEVEAYSWYTNNRGNSQGRRFDHIFASQKLNPVACRYYEDLREKKLSDHAPIAALFQPK